MSTTRRLQACAALVGLLALVAACGGGDEAGGPDRAVVYGPEAGASAGAAVAGDFNGDGTPDLALGAALADPDAARPDAGEVHILLGPISRGDAKDAAEASDVAIYGAGDGDQLGRRLATGDFDADGVDDLAIAAPSASNEAGEIHVMFGSSELGKKPNLFDLAASPPGPRVLGADPSDFAGASLAAGDFDADGADDLLIGALMADGPENSRPDAGEVYLVNGSALTAGGEIALAGWTDVFYGADPGDWLGETVGAADVDGDGADDAVIVATFADGPDEQRDAAGETYVVFSRIDLPLDLSESSANVTIIGRDAGDQLGHSLALGDADGDGGADIWLGAVSADGPNNGADLAGEAVLVLSSLAFDNRTVDAADDGMLAALVYGVEKDMRVGRSAAAGDVNGDGKSDLVISAPGVNERSGAVYVLNGGADYPDDVRDAQRTLTGDDPDDVFGTEVFGSPSLSVVDVDGDRRMDLLITAAQADGPDNARQDCGEVYVYFGG